MAIQLQKTYILGEYELEPDKRLLARAGVPVHLANRPFQVLLYLIEHRDRVVTRPELLERFWGGRDVYDDALRKCIGAIRKALDDRLDEPRFIETRWAEGYRYVGPLEERLAPPPLEFGEIERVRGVKIVVEEEVVDSAPKIKQPARLTSRIASRRALFGLSQAVALAVLAVSAAGLVVYLRGTSAQENRYNSIRSIAVMPIKNLTGDSSQEYFTDGVTESLITALSKIEGLEVISRTSSFTFKDKEVDARKVGEMLGVETILEGSLRKSATGIRVEVRLVSTQDGSILWAGDSYNRALEDILNFQDEIGCSVAAELEAKLCEPEEDRKQQTGNFEAYKAYLKGRYFYESRSSEGLRKALEYYQEAINHDPDYALAYAGLSRYYASSIWFLRSEHAQATRQAKLAATRAVEIDDTLDEAHIALAIVLSNEWDWAGADREFARAVELNPGNAEAHHTYAYHLVLTGRPDQAVREIRRALELDPLSVTINVDVGEILLYAMRYDEAIEALKHAIEMDYNRSNAHWDLALAYEQKGMFDEAVAEYIICGQIDGMDASVLAAMKEAYSASGMSGFWRTYLEAKREEARREYFPSFTMAAFCARAGLADEAFMWLEKAYAERSPMIMNLNVDPMIETLRADRRFADLLRRTDLSG